RHRVRQAEVLPLELLDVADELGPEARRRHRQVLAVSVPAGLRGSRRRREDRCRRQPGGRAEGRAPHASSPSLCERVWECRCRAESTPESVGGGRAPAAGQTAAREDTLSPTRAGALVAMILAAAAGRPRRMIAAGPWLSAPPPAPGANLPRTTSTRPPCRSGSRRSHARPTPAGWVSSTAPWSSSAGSSARASS